MCREHEDAVVLRQHREPGQHSRDHPPERVGPRSALSGAADAPVRPAARAGDSPKRMSATTATEASMKSINGPSGRTHPPVVTLNTAEMFSSSAARAPACSPKSRAVIRYMHPRRGGKADHERKTDDQARFAVRQLRHGPDAPEVQRRVIEVGERELPGGGHHVRFVDAESRRPGEQKPHQRPHGEHGDDNRPRAISLREKDKPAVCGRRGSLGGGVTIFESHA